MRYLFISLLLTSSFLFANEKVTKQCVDIEDDTERLSCYDSLFKIQQIEEPKLLTPKKKKETEIIKQDKQREINADFYSFASKE